MALIKQSFITKDELIPQLKNSKIIDCLIKNGNEIVSIHKKYRKVLIDIWKSLPTEKMENQSTFKFKVTDEHGYKGFYWCSSINRSFRNKDATLTFKEILHMCELNNLSINIKIKLETEEIVLFIQ